MEAVLAEINGWYTLEHQENAQRPMSNVQRQLQNSRMTELFSASIAKVIRITVRRLTVIHG